MNMPGCCCVPDPIVSSVSEWLKIGKYTYDGGWMN